MFNNHNRAEAYALVSDAIDEFNSLLDSIEPALLEEDWKIINSTEDKLTKAKEILNVG